MGAPDPFAEQGEEKPPLLPVEALQQMATCLVWMQHLREHAEDLMAEYRDVQRELNRLSKTTPILPE